MSCCNIQRQQHSHSHPGAQSLTEPTRMLLRKRSPSARELLRCLMSTRAVGALGDERQGQAPRKGIACSSPAFSPAPLLCWQQLTFAARTRAPFALPHTFCRRQLLPCPYRHIAETNSLTPQHQRARSSAWQELGGDERYLCFGNETDSRVWRLRVWFCFGFVCFLIVLPGSCRPATNKKCSSPKQSVTSNSGRSG